MPRAPGQLDGVQDAKHATVESLAAAVGRSRQTVQEWFAAMKVRPTRPYSEVEVRLWCAANGIDTDTLKAPSSAVAALLGAAAEPAASRAPKALDPLELVRLELARRQLAELDGKLIAITDVEQLVDALGEIAVAVFSDLPDRADQLLFPPAIDGAPPAPPLSSTVVRSRIEQLVRDGRASIAAQTRTLMRQHLVARRGVPPTAGTGGTSS